MIGRPLTFYSQHDADDLKVIPNGPTVVICQPELHVVR
jgi:hypothetical protein